MIRRRVIKRVRAVTVSGLTFVEIMATVCVLSLGIVFLHQSFYRSLVAVEHSRNLVLSRMILEEKLWEGIDRVRYGSGSTQEQVEICDISGRPFSLSRMIQPVDMGLYAVTMEMSWANAGRSRKTVVSTYVAI